MVIHRIDISELCWKLNMHLPNQQELSVSLCMKSSDLQVCLFCCYCHHEIQYIPRHMHTVFALLCFVVVIHWLIFPYPPGLLHWHCGNLTIAPMPAKKPWWLWINTSCEFIMNDCITTTKQITTKPCAYFLGCTVRTTSRLFVWPQFCTCQYC